MNGNHSANTHLVSGSVAFAVRGPQFGYRPLELKPLVPQEPSSVVPVATPRRGQAWGMAAHLTRQA
ncbi:MAG: hypothetical protein KC910_36495 [Candidatus Eremiobacteraeota bacterium]|nr:hypothetical protein [Candidatus Eremiobacteraeota bacterium]